MILEYHRPQSIDEALELLERTEPRSVPMGGGTWLNSPSQDSFAVVDLQDLAINQIQGDGKQIKIGATVTLQGLMKETSIQRELVATLRHEATINLRRQGTVAGTLVSSDGRSPFATAMLALDAQLLLLPDDEIVGLGDLLPVRAEKLKHRLITEITIPRNARLEYQYVARSPADLPIVCVAVAQWPSGRTRIAVGGGGESVRLALDGKGPDGALSAVESSLSTLQDEWASAEYRQEVGGVLVGRCLESIKTD